MSTLRFKDISEFALKLKHVVNDKLNCCININFLRAILLNARKWVASSNRLRRRKTNDQR